MNHLDVISLRQELEQEIRGSLGLFMTLWINIDKF